MSQRDDIQNALRSVPDIFGDRDIVAANRVERIDVDGGDVTLIINLPTDDDAVKQKVESDARKYVKSVKGVKDVVIMMKGSKPQLGASGPAQASGPGGGAPGAGSAGANPFDGQAPIEGVKHIIAVSSAKGGVGKSTVCVNLALALSQQGARVGLLDADVYGPSLQVLLGVTDRPKPGSKKEIGPVEKYGLKLMSLAFVSDPGQPVIWRGPIVMGVVKKFLLEVDWGELDYLMVDMPPGTGDTQLTLVQTVPLTGALIVTTPSDLALVDAEKGLQMYRSVKAPVMGIVENMSYFICPHCDGRTEIFSHGGTREIAERLDTQFLGEVPLDPSVRASGDAGKPIVLSDPESPVTRVFHQIAERIRSQYPA